MDTFEEISRLVVNIEKSEAMMSRNVVTSPILSKLISSVILTN